MRTRTFVGISLAVCILFVPLVAQQVTDAQKAEVEKILTEAHKEILVTLNQLKPDALSNYLSEDFQERVGAGNIGSSGKEAIMKWLNAVTVQRKSSNYDQDYLKIFVLSPDSAYVVQVGGISYVNQNGRHGGLGLATTWIWRKEQSGWKIIHFHESWW
jgi:ketosteroid isomerase-like protein